MSGLRFGLDVVRAALVGVRESWRPTPVPGPDAARAVHLLVEGDPGRDLSPAARYRAVQYVPLLEDLGFRACVYPSRPGKYFTASAGFQRAYARWPRMAMAYAHAQYLRQRRNRMADFRRLAGRGTVFLQRDLQALDHSDLDRTLPLWNRHVVFDFDDAIFAAPPWVPPAAGAHRAALEQKVGRVCGMAAVVLAANEHLAAFARVHCADVRVVPTALCTDEFRPPAAPPQNARPVVGWAGTSGNLWYLRAIAPALRALAERTAFALRVVCNEVPRGQLAGLPERNLEFVPWRAACEVERLQGFDVGIMPLQDDEWARGKAGFKLVQYMACGVPFVASPVGANPAVGGPDGECGVYAGSSDDWVAALEALLRDPDRRRALGARGRARAVAAFDRRVHAPAIAAALEAARRA